MKKLRNNDIVPDTIKPAIDFIKNIKQNDKVAIVHGHDCDSICSAAIMFKLVGKLTKAKPELIVSELNSILTESVLKKIKRIKPSYTIILDIPEIGINILTELNKISKVMIVDHHTVKGYVRVAYVNPRVYDTEAYLPTTYLAYRIYEKFFDAKEIVWIAGIGTLADMGMKNCLDLFQKIKTTNKELVDDLKNDDEILFEKSLLGKLTKAVDSARVIEGIKGSSFVLQLLIKVGNYDEILNNKKLLRLFELEEKEFGRLVEDFHRNKKLIKNVLLYEVKSRYSFNSPLATYLQKLFNDNILIVYQKSGKYFSFSFRKGKNVNINLGELSREIVKFIPDSSGGGHPNAAGARIPAKHLKMFLGNLEM